MEFVSTQVAVSIERKKAEDALRVSLEDTRQYAERMALLNRVARAVSTTLNLDNLLEIVYHEIINAVPADSFFVALYDRHTDQLEFRIRVDGEVHEAPYVRPLGNALTAQVVNNRKHLLIRDYELEKDHLPAMTLWGTGLPSRSWLGVPMQLGDEVLGVISVQAYSPNAFGERERELLSTIADTVAISIENARLYEEEIQRTARLTQIVKLGIDLASLRQEGEVLDTLVKRVAEVMESATCTVMLIDAEKNEAILTAQTGLPAGFSKTRIPLTLPSVRRLIETGEPLILADIDRQDPSIRQILIRPDLKAFFAYPMLRGGQVIGVITLSSLRPYNPSAEEISACHLLAERAAAALENARLFEITEHHLQQVQSLRTIDAAIASSFDLRSILSLIINQIIAQLGVDAADVLLLNPHNYAFEYSVGKGFLTNTIEKSRFLLGEGVIGHQIMEHRTIHIPDLKAVIHNFVRAEIFLSEGFTTYSAVPLIAKGEIKGVLEVYQRTPNIKGGEWVEFLETLAGQVAIAIDNSQLFSNLQRSNLELSLAYDATIEGWSRALDMRDRVTEGHTKRVTEMALNLARTMGMSDSDLVHMRRGILLHDMGKMGIPDDILLKPDSLTEEEWKIMHMHPQYAFEMLSPISYLRPALDIPGSHHEKWDGTGYPRGLKGEQIPMAARIFAVVDVFDALTSDRPYRKAWPKDKAIQYILNEKGKFFDPRVVEVFMSLKHEMGLTQNGDSKLLT
jgi:HD-GYP domain-containing protein (c-di-GMP phosphodiesterase class II)